jgi:hypothetical protein
MKTRQLPAKPLFVVLLIGIMIITTSTAFTTLAQEHPGLNNLDLGSNSSEILISESNANGENEVMQIQSNPYGCYGQSNNPHHSTHYPGTINVTAFTSCSQNVPEIYVETTLQRYTCFIFCWWGNAGPKGSSVRYGRSYVETNSSTSCKSGTYRGVSYHYIIGWDGIRYEAYTISNVVNLTCP